ncbi:ATP synthase subunit I [Craterilacuibacter sp.]|uniref:ATP synthase subunit I n=1 Tax=Craterilacuibacter sp. TaxID=2870909 RepID=UPI003F2D577C
MVKPEVRRVIRLQSQLTVVAVVVAAVIGWGDIALPVSALLGGLSAILPALAYVWIAYSVQRAPPMVLMKAHYKAETVKFFLTIILFAVVLLFFKDISVVAYFAGYLLAVSGYWFGLLIKIEKK